MRRGTGARKGQGMLEYIIVVGAVMVVVVAFATARVRPSATNMFNNLAAQVNVGAANFGNVIP